MESKLFIREYAFINQIARDESPNAETAETVRIINFIFSLYTQTRDLHTMRASPSTHTHTDRNTEGKESF